MKKATKVILILLLILCLFPLVTTILVTGPGRFLNFHWGWLAGNTMILQGLQQFLFWLSVGLLILALIGFFVIIFFPKAENTLVMEKAEGQLKIQKKALENYVLAAVQEEPFIDDPKVDATIKKHKIAIKISGQMRKVFQVPEKQQVLSQKIKGDLQRLLGPENQITTDVVYKNYANKTRRESPRVE